MITLLSTIFGFAGSLIPSIISTYKEKKDREHELAIMRLQMEQQSLGHSERMEEIGAQADIAEASAIYRTYTTGITWVDALNGTVRPVITYAFFGLYATIKAAQIYATLKSGISIGAVWGEEDQCIFATVISFYFGQRMMSKYMKRV